MKAVKSSFFIYIYKKMDHTNQTKYSSQAYPRSHKRTSHALHDHMTSPSIPIQAVLTCQNQSSLFCNQANV